jgi:hypothetical protein
MSSGLRTLSVQERFEGVVLLTSMLRDLMVMVTLLQLTMADTTVMLRHLEITVNNTEGRIQCLTVHRAPSTTKTEPIQELHQRRTTVLTCSTHHLVQEAAKMSM